MNQFKKEVFGLPTGVTTAQISENTPKGFSFHSINQYPEGGGMKEKITYIADGAIELFFDTPYETKLSIFSDNPETAKAEAERLISEM